MANARDTITAFLRGKGLSGAAIDGILGNLKVESGLSSTAYNANEGAIGIAQWEGGRRSALQSFAASHGGKESDLNIQLGYLWHELTTSESGALSAIKGASTAAQAAAIWDADYERSAGTTRGARVSAAESYAAGTGYAGDSASASQVGGTGGVEAQAMSKSDYRSVDNLGSLLDQVPELSHLVDQAVGGNWSGDKFQNAVEDSQWWKQHSSSARSVIIQQANDPASYNQTMQQTLGSIMSLSHQLGMGLTTAQAKAIAASALLSGNDSNQQWLTQQISGKENYSKLTSTSGLQGGMANTAQQLETMMNDYGYNWSPSTIGQYAQRVVSGGTTIDTYKNQLMSWAKSAFPALSKQIDEGQTVKSLADPYTQSMSQLLEVDPGTLNLFTPLIRQALQGTTDPKSKDRVATPLWQFEQQVRSDPRWAYTQNATDTMSTALTKIGSDFGFGI